MESQRYRLEARRDWPAAGRPILASPRNGMSIALMLRMTSGVRCDHERTEYSTRAADAPVWVSRAARLIDEIRALRVADGASAVMDELTLWGGLAGDAVLFATYAHVTGDETATGFALGRARALAARLPEIADMGDKASLGATIGIGAIIYALVRCSDALGDFALLDAALRGAALVTRERIMQDAPLDVIDGAAGCCLALLALVARTHCPRTLSLALACGTRLIDARCVSASGLRAWATNATSPPLTGFGHGASGIACALARLSAATGREEFAMAAVEGFDYERTHFSSAEGNWADLRTDGSASSSVRYTWGWCAGAPGIALARIGAARAGLRTPELTRDLDHALASTSLRPVVSRHHVCCGTMSRVDALLEGATLSGDSSHHGKAKEMASSAWRQLKESAEGPASRRRFPHFFEGLGGIAFECLRLSSPKRVASLLLFE